MANQLCSHKKPSSARRWLFRFFALLLLIILGWLGLEQYRLRIAPVINIAEDGSVRINGHLIEITSEGLPPKVLEEMEGGPPAEDPRGQTSRKWRYPRTGVTPSIVRRVDGQMATYTGVLELGTTEHWDFPCWLEVRGQRWWLGPPGLQRSPPKSEVARCLHPDDDTTNGGEWYLNTHGGPLGLGFRYDYPLRWMHLDYFPRDQLNLAYIETKPFQGRTVTGKSGEW